MSDERRKSEGHKGEEAKEDMSGEITRWEWNDEVGNYCLKRSRSRKSPFVIPLVQMKVCERDMEPMEFMEIVQSVNYKRSGRILDSFELNDFIELAKKLGIYDGMMSSK